jgi:hypothetical protein
MAKINELASKYGVNSLSSSTIDSMDPTAKKKYLSWLFKVRYESVGNGKFKVKNEFPASIKGKVKGHLEWREKNAQKIPKEYKDINAFKSITEFMEKTEEMATPSRTEVKNNVRVVHDDVTWKVVVPLSFETSKLYGSGTKWCTTQKTYFNDYTRNGELYYIIDKAHNRKFGLPLNGQNKLTNLNNAVFYNNEDAGLRFNQLKVIYGNSLMVIGKSITTDFNTHIVKRVLERNVKNLDESMKNMINTLIRTGATKEQIKSELSPMLRNIFDKMLT